MDLSDDLPPPRRPLFFPVVIATVCLSIIGMSLGLVLASRQKADERQGAQQQTQQQRQAPVVTAATTRPSGPPCRDETQAAARRFDASGTLRRKLLLRTKTSVVFICQDDSGRLYYHANRGGEDAKWIENETALFLPDVQSEGDDAYVVTASDGTNFSITPERLFIVHTDGTPEEQPAV